MRGPVDMHTHTTASDGTDSPEELVAAAISAGLAAVAVTDHDTVSGLDAAVAAGGELGIEVVRGCELAVSSPFGEVHILGLFLPENAPGLLAAFAENRESRAERNREIIDNFQRSGYDISYSELLAQSHGETIGRPHIASLLVKKGICASRLEAFSKFLADGKSMYVPRSMPGAREGLELLRREGAVTVFAHPMLLKAPLDKLELLVREYADMGLDAIEAHHANHDAKAVRRAESIAKRYGLAVSGGSDYHGEARPGIMIGKGKGNLHLSYAILENLRGLKEKRT